MSGGNLTNATVMGHGQLDMGDVVDTWGLSTIAESSLMFLLLSAIALP